MGFYKDYLQSEKGDEELIDALSKGPDEVIRALNKGVRIEARDREGRSALMNAAANGYMDVVKVLLERKADINAAKYEGTCVLHCACMGGHEDIVRLLIEKGAQLDQWDNHRHNTLQVAAKGDHVEIVELLLDNGLKLEETCDGKTALHLAAKNKNEKIMSLLLDRGANIDAKCSKGKTALFYACTKGIESNVKILLQRGARIDVTDEDGSTCLAFAVESGNESLVKLLLDSGVNIDTSERCWKNPLYLATYNSSETMIQLLLDRGADVTSVGRCWDLNSTLHYACKRGFENIVRQLVERGANVQEEGESGQSVLHAAVLSGNENIVKFILDFELDVSGKEEIRFERTPLHFAAKEGHLHLIELLLRRGAAVNEKDKLGRTALYFATNRKHDCAVELLLERGASIDFTCTSWVHPFKSSRQGKVSFNYHRKLHSALHVAAELGNELIARKFLDRGIDVNIRGENNLTALHVASVQGQTEVVRLLLDHGADMTIKTFFSNQSTALHLACLYGQVDVVKLLLDNGANINEKDESGDSALFVAIRKKSQAIIRVLLDYGADEELKNQSHSTPLLYAIQQMKREEEEQAKKESNSWNYYYSDDFSEYNYLKIIEQLLDHGVNTGVCTNEEFPATVLQYAMNQYYKRTVKLLLNYGADINECTLGTYCSRIEVIKKMVQMLSKKEYVNEDLVNTIKGNFFPSKDQVKCQEEIDKMKTERIGNSAILFYDLLTCDNLTQLAAFARNEDMLQSFKSSEYDKFPFPVYQSTLNYQLQKGLWRKLLLSKVQGFFHAVANVKENRGLAKLPAFCISEIFSYLRNRDLRTLIRVCNIKFDVEMNEISITSPRGYSVMLSEMK